MVVFLFLLVAIGVAVWYGRWHLMIHHPEKYEQLHRAEKEFAKVQVAATERAVRGLVAAIKGMGRLLGSRKV
jgi:hypothetical protein